MARRKREGTLGVWLLASIVALTGVALISGCAGDELNRNASLASLRQLNAGCAAHNRKLAMEILQAYDLPEVKRASSERQAINLEVSVFLPILLGDAEARARTIRRFDSPDPVRRRFRVIARAYQAWIDRAKRNPRQIVLANDVYNLARDLAGDYGLTDCELNPFKLIG